MLCQFHVQNLGLMKDICLNLEEGFTVFTGETGAGKSMLIDALGILLGDRASAEFIRHGEERANVEGILEDIPLPLADRLTEAGFPLEDGQLFLARELNVSGRNFCRIQGRIVPLSLYRTLCKDLVDIHGQMEHQTLFHAEAHRELLDALGGDELAALLKEVNQMVRSYKEAAAEEKKLKVSEAERVRQQDLLKYQIQEIEEIAPQPGEEESLNLEKKRLNNGEKILHLAAESYAWLYEGEGNSVYDLLGQVRKSLAELHRLDDEMPVMPEQVDSLYYAVEDLAESMRTYKDEFDYQPGRLDEIESRLIQLGRLRKYGTTTEEILDLKKQMEDELQQLIHHEVQMEEIMRLKNQQLLSYTKLAHELTAQRKQVGAFLEQELAKELADLGMPHARIEVRYDLVQDPSYGGAETVEFYFSANLGEPPKPLAKVASGGEMARLMLALKSILARFERAGTFIFDEVDSGVGGTTIQKVGEKLARIAESRQVFCITHSPYVAACAETHFRIYKNESAGRTYTQVEKITAEERIEEVTRMLGDEGQISRQHAEQLLKIRDVL